MTSATPRLSSSPSQYKHQAQTRRRRPLGKQDNKISSLSEEEAVSDHRPDVAELRRRRADFYSPTAGNQRITEQREMAERTTPRRIQSSRLHSSKRPEVTVREVREDHSQGRHHHRRRAVAPETIREPEHVYIYHTRSPLADPPPLQRSKTTRTIHAPRPKDLRRNSEDSTKSHRERRPSYHREDEKFIRRVVSVNRPEPTDHSKNHHRGPSVTR